MSRCRAPSLDFAGGAGATELIEWGNRVNVQAARLQHGEEIVL